MSFGLPDPTSKDRLKEALGKESGECEVTFLLQQSHPQSAAIVGNIPQLGSWNTNQRIFMNKSYGTAGGWQM